MSEKQVQLEIFEQGIKSKKSRAPYIVTDNAPPPIKFPTHVCVMVSCYLIAILVIFTLGIERGKAIAKKHAMPLSAGSEHVVKAEPAAPVLPQAAVSEPVKNTVAIPNKNLEKEEKSATLAPCAYVIQVATYKKNSSYVQKEVARLEEKGFQAFVKSSGDYMVVYAGNFENKESAQKQLSVLKKTYRDCFIKQI